MVAALSAWVRQHATYRKLRQNVAVFFFLQARARGARWPEGGGRDRSSWRAPLRKRAARAAN
jgi:hypothetical protein